MAGFSFPEERQKTPEPLYFQGIGRGKGRKKEEGFVGGIGVWDGIFGGGKGKGWEGGRERRGPCKIGSHKVLNLLFYSVFYDTVRINYNLPAGYFASAMTTDVMAEALYPHGRLYLILSPSLLPPPFPSPKSQENPPEKKKKTLPTSPQHPKTLTLFSLFLSLLPALQGLAFPFQEKDRKPLNPCIFKRWEGRREGRRRKGLLGGLEFGMGFLGQGRGRDGRGKEEDLGDLCSSRSFVYSFILFL